MRLCCSKRYMRRDVTLQSLLDGKRPVGPAVLGLVPGEGVRQQRQGQCWHKAVQQRQPGLVPAEGERQLSSRAGKSAARQQQGFVPAPGCVAAAASIRAGAAGWHTADPAVGWHAADLAAHLSYRACSSSMTESCSWSTALLKARASLWSTLGTGTDLPWTCGAVDSTV